VRAVPTDLPDVLVIEADVYRDARGFFVESFHAAKYEALGIPGPFVQDNHSLSAAGTIRGLHLQVGRPQAKLVRTIEGSVFDVAVDVRSGSPTFGRWVGVALSADNFRQLYIPSGYAHGFAVLSPTAQVEYKCTDYYDPASEVGIAWNDPQIGIRWPVETPILSERDRRSPHLAALTGRLPSYPTTDS
jgi:dTDP-4-dehydrorhamnose 3,5-epimerase